MSVDGFCCKSIWAAAALLYVEYPLSRIEIVNKDEVEFQFDAPSFDAQQLVDDYEAGCLALSDAKSYSLAFTKLNTRVRDMRRRGESSREMFNRAKDDAYWARVRENVEARRRERDAREAQAQRKR
jgi:hypothetical protein